MKSKARKGNRVPRENEGYYTEDENGQLYFHIGRTRIKVIEHFPDEGETIIDRLESLILSEARLKNWFKE